MSAGPTGRKPLLSEAPPLVASPALATTRAPAAAGSALARPPHASGAGSPQLSFGGAIGVVQLSLWRRSWISMTSWCLCIDIHASPSPYARMSTVFSALHAAKMPLLHVSVYGSVKPKVETPSFRSRKTW